MELKNISKEDYMDFALKSPYISIYQLEQWGMLKKTTGWISHLVGLYDGENLKGVSLLLQKKLPLGLNLFYSPRGFLLDVNDYELLKEFTLLLREYIKSYKGLMIKVDPNVIYATYDSQGQNKKLIGSKAFENFQKLNYKHFGFNKNFETMQPRFLCRFKLLDTYDETLQTFSKTTRKNIEKTEKMGVRARCIDESEMDLFVSLLEETGKTKHFAVRPASYYKKMYELMHDYIKLYISYIDTNLYYEYVTNEIELTKKELNDINKQMETINVGNKLKIAKEQHEKKLENLTKSLEEAEEMKKHSKQINIGALLSVFIGNEGITFMSGTDSNYKGFNPKYAFYNEHIKECFKQKKEYCNFYGISGDINPNNKNYSIYELKKGFRPDIIELIGEFDLIISKFKYNLYKFMLWVYKKTK